MSSGSQGPDPAQQPKPLTRQQIQDELFRTQRALGALIGKVDEMQKGLEERDKAIGDFLKKVEEASKAQPAPGSATAQAQAGAQPATQGMMGFIDSLVPGGIRSVFGGGPPQSQESALEGVLLDEMRKSYLVWLRTGIRAMNKAAGLAEHMTLE